jgi:hypothetical protein
MTIALDQGTTNSYPKEFHRLEIHGRRIGSLEFDGLWQDNDRCQYIL